jgi:esterase
MTQLHYSKVGKGDPLIILHGLYGSGSNWHTIGKALSQYFTVYMPDQRNHGNSFHDPELNYTILTSDLEEFMNTLRISKACLLGHSMGGKTVMKFTFEHPDRVTKLVVIDIAMRSYMKEFRNNPTMQSAVHQKIVHALTSLDIDFSETRDEVDKQMARYVPQKDIRQFLLKNLKRDETGKFYWGLNINAVKENLSRLLDEIIMPDKPFPGPVMVISGKRSGYISELDKKDFRTAFPAVQIEELDSGHWVHAEQPDELLDLLMKFLP